MTSGSSHRPQRDLIDQAWQQVAQVESGSNTTIVTGDMQRAAGRLALNLPEQIPGYVLLNEIHRGGQGVVFRARQDSTQRIVAIKLMREGPFATADERARFDREVRILAQLKHPNIVSIYHSDVAASFFYYVMDYIDGEALDTWSRRSRRTLAELVEAFAQICEALEAAHLRGVIHRDLKPGNIRIDVDDRPHVLDFGLSKLIDSDDASSMTMTGQFVGSAPWASPEQASGAAGGVDVRTDVYSLGVLLYQMLTGRFPYDVAGSRHDVLQRIRTDEPRRPRTVRGDLPVDLETIVLKCLQKDPQRRYQSAGELARDVRRYQANEPIEARRDSISYLLVKQIARHRVPATIGGLFLLSILIGLVTSLTFWRQAVVAQRDANEQLRRAEASALVAEQERETAEEAKRRAEATAVFLEQILTAADPRSDFGPETTARDLVEVAARRLDDGQLAEQPLVEERVRRTLARSLQGLGAYDEAAAQFQRAATLRSDGTDPETRIAALLEHAQLLEDVGLYEEARAMFEEALELLAAHPEFEDGPLEATALRGLGIVLRALGAFPEAEQMLRESLALTLDLPEPDPVALLLARTNLGLLLASRGEYVEAHDLLGAVVESARSILPDDSPDLAAVLSNFADLLRQMERPNEAIPIMREALDVQRRGLPEDHPHIGVLLNNLGQVYQALERYEEAEPLLVRALAITRAARGSRSGAVAIMTNNLAQVRQEQGKFDEAAAAFGEAIEILREVHTDRHPNVAMGLYNLARLHAKQDAFDAADPLVAEAYETFEQVAGPDHPQTLRCGLLYGRVLAGLGETAAAVDLLTALHAKAEVHLAHDPSTRVAIRYGLGSALLRAERYADAEPHLLAAFEELPEARYDKIEEVLTSLVLLYTEWDKPEEAARWQALLDDEAGED